LEREENRIIWKKTSKQGREPTNNSNDAVGISITGQWVVNVTVGSHTIVHGQSYSL
jgi:hypothetical protein